MEELARSREFFDFITDDVDAARVGGVEFEGHGGVGGGGAIHAFGSGDYGRCLNIVCKCGTGTKTVSESNTRNSVVESNVNLTFPVPGGP